MVSEWVSEIETINVSEVILFWNELIFDFIGCLILIVPALSLGQSFLEGLTRVRTEILLLFVLLDIRTSLGQALCSLLGITMGSVVGVVLLELANIGFPAEIGLINEGNSSIGFFTSFVLMMGVESLVGSRADLSISLKIGFLNWRSHNLVLRSDDGDLHSVRLGLHRDCLLHIVVGFLLTEETHDFVVGHTVSFFADCWDGLDKTYHSLVTFRIEFSVVSGLDVGEFVGAILLWGLRNIIFN